MTHSKSCEKAIKTPCVCECGHALHGWRGMIDLVPATADDPARAEDARHDYVNRIRGAHARAQPPRPTSTGPGNVGDQSSAGGRRNTAADADRAADPPPQTPAASPVQQSDRGVPAGPKGTGNTAPETPKQARNRHQEPRFRKNAAVGMALPDLIDALGSAPETAKAVRALGELIEHDLHPAFEEEARKAGLEPAKEARTHHFWCEVAAAAAEALSAARNSVRRAEHSAAEWITLPLRRAELPPALHGLAIAATAKLLRSLRSAGISPTEWVTALRILAVAICPQPHQHPELVRRALLPLRRLVTGEVMAEIRAEFGMSGSDPGETPAA